MTRFTKKIKCLEYNNIKKFFLNNSNKNTIYFLCRKICDEIILKYIFSVLTSEEHKSLYSPRLDQLFIDFYKIERDYNFFESIKANNVNHDVKIAKNGFLAFPWRRDSLTWMLDKFSYNDFEWKQDTNHSITFVKPFNVYFVNGGNHSIACGRLFRKDSIINCDSTIDYTNILKEYDYKNGFFINRNGKKINRPYSKELLNLFFLGKILVET
jgi:hypothetical protein